jgi:hypothetical protein
MAASNQHVERKVMRYTFASHLPDVSAPRRLRLSPSACRRAALKRWLCWAPLLLCLPMANTHAATLNLALDGRVGDAQVEAFDYGNAHYETWFLQLNGLDALRPATVMQGDLVQANVLLDQPTTVQGSMDYTFVELILSGSAFPAIDTGTTGTTAFFNSGVAGLSGGSSCTTSSQLVNCLVLFPPDNTRFTFDRVVAEFTVDVLGQPALLDGASLYIARISPVPESQTSAMLLLGLTTLTYLRRRALAAPRIWSPA